jgi:hypothetical protein
VKDKQTGETAHSRAVRTKGQNWIAYLKRKVQERKATRENETATDRAVRITATATVWMAIFTLVLTFVGIVTLVQLIEGGQDTHDLAEAAKKQADLTWLTAESTQAASFKINEIDPIDGDYWRVFTVNFGKAIAPTFDLTYSVVHQSFPDERVIDQSGPFSISRAEVLPTDPTKGTGVVFDFSTPGYGPQDNRLTSAEETFSIKGKLSYLNGFNRKVEEPFCWQTYPWTDSKVGWDLCLMAKSALSRARRNRSNGKSRPQTKPN